MRSLIIFVLATLLAASLCGCATNCRDVLVRWDYTCKRRYQLCTIQGHSEAYCRQVIEACWMDSNFARENCTPPPEDTSVQSADTLK